MAKAKWTLTNAAAKRVMADLAAKMDESCGFGSVRALDECLRSEGLRAHDRREAFLGWLHEQGQHAYVAHLAREMSRELDYAREKLQKVANSCRSVVDEVENLG